MKNTLKNYQSSTASPGVISKSKYLSKASIYFLSFSFVFISFTQNLVAQVYSTIAAGSYTSASTWLSGVVPGENAEVIIKHAISLTSVSATASKITIAKGGSLTINTSAALMASNSLTVSGGSLLTSGGTVNVGTSGGGNKVLTLSSGTLKVTSGIVNVNGNIIMTGGAFVLTGGNLSIDPNTGLSTTSVAKNIDIFSLSSAVKTTVTGGTITFVDPPYAGTGRTFVYSCNTYDADWAGNTIVFGGTQGKNTTSGGTYGFNIDTRAIGDSGRYIKLGNVILNGGSGKNRFVSGAAIATHGFDIGGDLTINPGGEGRTLTGGAVLRIQGNIYNKGKFVDYAGVIFGGRTAANTKAQYVTNYNGKGVFWNHTDMYKANAHFTNVEFNNIATPKAITFNFGDGIIVDGAVGVSHKVDFINGAIEIGSDNMFVMRKTCTSKHVNGFLLRGGAGQLVKEFPKGASTFTYHIADTSGNFDYAPVTISLTANDFDARIITINQKDIAHPKIKIGSTPTDYISRFWQMVCTSPGKFAGTITCEYLDEDIVGTESKIKFSNWNGIQWNENTTIQGTKQISVKINQSTWSRGSICEVSGRACNTTTSATAKTIGNTSVGAVNAVETAKANKITLYPNPVTNKKINLQFATTTPDQYNVTIVNTNGQKVYSSIINQEGTAVSQISLPANISNGIYNITMVDKQNQLVTKNFIVSNN